MKQITVASVVIAASLMGTSSASAVVSSDTLSDPNCNSSATERITEVYPDHSVPHEDDAWEVSRTFRLEAQGGRNGRVLNLSFYGQIDGRSVSQPTVARNFYDDRGQDTNRTTTVLSGESSATVRIHLGDKRTIELGTFKPDWDSDSVGPEADGYNVVGPQFGSGVGTWALSIPLRKHLKALRKHEYKAKGSRTRVSLNYEFPTTRFVRNDYLWGGFGGVPGVATGTKNWTPAACELRSRRLRLSIR